MIFYGTGGAEGVPAPFCRCVLCEYARKNGGKDRRMRSMLRVSESVCIDMGPDAACAAALYGDFFSLEHVLITHTHEDHFYYALTETRSLSKPAPDSALNIWLADSAFDITGMYRENPAFMGAKLSALEKKGVVNFRKLEFGAVYDADGISVIPLRGNHHGNLGELPANYLLTLPDGTKLFYAVDTGYFLPETFDALQNCNLDILICECTNGNSFRGDKPDFHLDFDSCISVCRELLEIGAISKTSNVYLTHINHKHSASHADLERLARSSGLPCKLKIAWDGLII